MRNWKYLFEDKILDRGYFYTDSVEITQKTDKKVKATVRGTFDYQTEITFDDGLVDDMYCTCPYFERDNCKHLAALLYVLEDFKDIPVEKEDFTQLFNSVDEDDLREFLFSELENNAELLNRFKLKFSDTIDSQYYKNKLGSICFQDKNRYLINDFLTNEMNFLLNKKEYGLVLELLDYVFPYIREWWNYWEDYGSDGNMEEVEEIVSKLINTPVHGDVFEWLGELIYYNSSDDHMHDLTNLYFDEFENREELKTKEKLADKLYSRTGNIKWIKHRIDLMEKLDCSSDEINEFREDYLEYEEIMDSYIDSTGGEQKEKLLLKAIKQFEYNEKYKLQLKDYYFNNDFEKYLKVLEEMVFEYPNIEYFREFKNSFEGDWISKRSEILKKHDDVSYFVNECYEVERMYDLLVDNVNSLWDLNRYREVLTNDYSDELVRKYAEIAVGKARKSGPPKHYLEIVEILKTMNRIPGGDKTVEILVENFKREYKRRPRMLQALREGGF